MSFPESIADQGRRGNRGLAALIAAGVLTLTVLIAVASARGQATTPDPTQQGVDPTQAGVDQFPSKGHVNVTIDNLNGQQVTEDIDVSSEGLPDAQVDRGALQNGSIPTEIISMQLRGNSESLGPVVVRVGQQQGLPPTQGAVQNVQLDENGHFASGDSFFDVFFEIQLPNSPLGLLTAQNQEPLNMSTPIFDLPPNQPRATPTSAYLIDHYKCYRVRQTRGIPFDLNRRQQGLLKEGRRRSRTVETSDQLETRSEKVLRPIVLCNPVAKRFGGARTPMIDSDSHLVCYKHDDRKGDFTEEAVGIRNQFVSTTVDLKRRDFLCVPSRKRVRRGKEVNTPGTQSEARLSHFKCYTARDRREAGSYVARLNDQFERRRLEMAGPRRLCNPVEKDGSEITNEFAHMTCHPFTNRRIQPRIVEVRNQFGLNFLVVRRRDSLCLPTHKTICTEYAERAKVTLNGPGGVPVGSVNQAIHVPYEEDPEGSCP